MHLRRSYQREQPCTGDGCGTFWVYERMTETPAQTPKNWSRAAQTPRELGEAFPRWKRRPDPSGSKRSLWIHGTIQTGLVGVVPSCSPCGSCSICCIHEDMAFLNANDKILDQKINKLCICVSDNQHLRSCVMKDHFLSPARYHVWLVYLLLSFFVCAYILIKIHKLS